jgi:hypothetical protein
VEQASATSVEPGEPWDAAGLSRLAAQGNPATLSLLDLCAPDAEPVGVVDVARHAGITVTSVRGQLAGLTMRLKNPRYHFRQKATPADIEWLPGGIASYTLNAELGAIWRAIRARPDSQADTGLGE